MNKFLWLLISVLSFLASAYALEVAPNTTDELLKFLDAQPVPVGFFEQHKDAVFIEPALAVLLRPRLYPDNAAIFTQAVFGFDRKVNLFRRDERVELKETILEAQAMLDAIEEIDNMSKQGDIPSKSIKLSMRKSISNEIDNELKNSPKIKSLEKVGNQDIIFCEKQKITLEIARQHLSTPDSVRDREESKEVEVLAAKRLLRHQYEIGIEGSVPAYIVSNYGNFDTPTAICQTINSFLNSRGIDEQIYYYDKPITFAKIKNLLNQKKSIVIALRRDQQIINVCLLGYAEINGDEIAITALVPNGWGAHYGTLVPMNCDKWVYQFNWKKFSDNIIGCYAFIKKD